jgi:hypothetical protein
MSQDITALMGYVCMCSDRFVEEVNPMVVQAQRALIVRVAEAGGKPPPQPHFAALIEKLGHPITAADYVSLVPRAVLAKEDIVHIPAEARMDPHGYDIYTGRHRQCLTLITS